MSMWLVGNCACVVKEGLSSCGGVSCWTWDALCALLWLSGRAALGGRLVYTLSAIFETETRRETLKNLQRDSTHVAPRTTPQQSHRSPYIPHTVHSAWHAEDRYISYTHII